MKPARESVPRKTGAESPGKIVYDHARSLRALEMSHPIHFEHLEDMESFHATV